MEIFLSRLISFLSFVISPFNVEAEGLLEGVDGDVEEVELPVVAAPLDPEEGDAVEAVDPTVGTATLVPEEDPVVAAKAFPETIIPMIAVAIPAFPMAIAMDFFDPFLMFPLLFWKVKKDFWSR